MTVYMITAEGFHWEKCNAKTLTGAKRCATREFAQAVGGKIIVGIDHETHVQRVATKYGYDEWVTDPSFR